MDSISVVCVYVCVLGCEVNVSLRVTGEVWNTMWLSFFTSQEWEQGDKEKGHPIRAKRQLNLFPKVRRGYGTGGDGKGEKARAAEFTSTGVLWARRHLRSLDLGFHVLKNESVGLIRMELASWKSSSVNTDATVMLQILLGSWPPPLGMSRDLPQSPGNCLTEHCDQCSLTQTLGLLKT